MNTLPPTYELLVRLLLPKEKGLRFLDLGCGYGMAGEIFNKNHKYSFTGVDVFDPYLKKVSESGYYDKVQHMDLKNYKVPRDKYDVTLLFQVLEHLSKRDGIVLLKSALKSSRKAVLVSIPNGECKQAEYDENPYQKHSSSWSVEDFRKLGFSIYGQGLKFVYRGKSYARKKNVAFWQKISFVFSLFLTPVIFFLPNLGAQLICVKYVK